MTLKRKVERVRLTLQAHRLKNVAGAFSVSNPYAVLTLLAPDNSVKPKIIGKTDVIQNSLNPVWTTAFYLDFQFGKTTNIHVRVYDSNPKKEDAIMISGCIFEVGAILGSKANVLAKRFKNNGTIFARVVADKLENCGTLQLYLRASKVKNLEIFGKTNPFFELCVLRPNKAGKSWQVVYRSEHVISNLNPNFKPFTLDLRRVYEGDLHKKVRFLLYDWQKSGKHRPLGALETTLAELLDATPHDNFPVIFKRGHKRKEVGCIHVKGATVHGHGPTLNRDNSQSSVDTSHYTSSSEDGSDEENTDTTYNPKLFVPEVPDRPTFVDYLSGGCEINTIVAIDFAGSNGDPRMPGTLHHISREGSLNEYEKAIIAILGVLEQYDTSKRFPVWGFAGKFNGVVQQCFQCGPKAEAIGLEGVLDHYRSIFSSGLIMSKPTILTKVFEHAAKNAKRCQALSAKRGKQAYTVLLVITDGVVSDIEKTKEVLADIAGSPLSIVIVGVGNKDFYDMQDLDDFAHGPRDIVQFVEFQMHQNNRQSLAAATLEEIPDQLVNYFFLNGIQPLKLEYLRGSSLLEDGDECGDIVDGLKLNLDVSTSGEMRVLDGGVYDQTAYQASFVSATSYLDNDCSYSDTFSRLSLDSQNPVRKAPLRAAQAPPSTAPIYIQVPINMRPGMKMKIRNPTNRRLMVVTIPDGVQPGETFMIKIGPS